MAPTPKYTLDQVFQSGGIPNLTYVDRSGGRLLGELRDQLGQSGKLICVHGPSKSGKTVFCRKVMERRNPILLRGNSIKKVGDFWDSLSIAKGSRNRLELERMLERDRNPILLDDFHKIASAVQVELVDSFRTITNYGNTIVIISIYDFVLKLFLQDAELGGRTFEKKFPWWESTDIAKIGFSGLEKLNISVSSDVINTLARFSCRTPILMQDACFMLCTKLQVTETQDKISTRVVPAAILQEIFSELAQRENAFFARLRSRGRPAVMLKTGRGLNLPDAVLYALSFHQVVLPLKIFGLRRILKLQLDERRMTAPSMDELREAVKLLAEKSRTELDLRSALVFDQDKVYIDHPHFFVWLRWCLAPSLGRELPSPFHRKEK